MNNTENTEQAIVSNHQQLQTRSNIPNNNWQQETKPKNVIEFHIKDLKARPPRHAAPAAPTTTTATTTTTSNNSKKKKKQNHLKPTQAKSQHLYLLNSQQSQKANKSQKPTEARKQEKPTTKTPPPIRAALRTQFMTGTLTCLGAWVVKSENPQQPNRWNIIE